MTTVLFSIFKRTIHHITQSRNMAFESLTDDKIMDLVKCPKRCTNPQARKKVQFGTEQINYRLEATDDSGHQFLVYSRQNMRAGMQDDFSCGIAWISPSGQTITLRRYNGASHRHKNHLEGDRLSPTYHIHYATEKYIRSNLKADGFACATERYCTLGGALHCLIKDCKISGLTSPPDYPAQTQLFS